MKGDKLGIAVRKAVSQLTKNGGQTDGGVSQNIFSKGILLALGGVMGYILRASMNNIEQEYVNKVYIFICQMTTKYSERIASTLIDHTDPTLHEQPINMMEPCIERNITTTISSLACRRRRSAW